MNNSQKHKKDHKNSIACIKVLFFVYKFLYSLQPIHLHTGVPHKSACNCIRRLLVDIFPSVFNFVNGNPQSLCIASRISLV